MPPPSHSHSPVSQVVHDCIIGSCCGACLRERLRRMIRLVVRQANKQPAKARRRRVEQPFSSARHKEAIYCLTVIDC
jgi:hypothetical protein